MIDNKLVEELPINGENVVALAALLPGVTAVNAPTTETNERGGPTYSVSGSRNTQNLMLFDGLMWNNLFYNTGISYPPHEALQEISVLLNNYTAQYGSNSGSIFNVLTRSGHQHLSRHCVGLRPQHQSRCHRLLCQEPFYPHPLEDRQNQVGFTVGGPIKREKAYFFVSLQDLFAHKQAIGSVNPFSENMLGFENDGVTPYPCNSAGPFAGKQCGDFNQYMNTAENPALGVSGGSVIKMTIPDQSTTGGADEMINNGYWQAGNGNGAIPSPCIQDLANASVL
jgi:hypothetical protein